jgi:hypothetical protein
VPAVVFSRDHQPVDRARRKEEKRREEARPDAPTAGVDRYATYRLGGMRDPLSAQQAAMNKCLAQSNKSSGRAETTKGATIRVPPMSNILKIVDLTDDAIRRAVFAVLDGLAAEHRANRKGSERLLRMQERDKRQVREFIGGRR